MEPTVVLSALKAPAVWLARKAIGPRLQLEYHTASWPRCREYVLAEDATPTLWSPPLTGYGSQADISNALYVRLHLSNPGLRRARECGVFLERVEYGGGPLLENESSPLNWTDIDGFDLRQVDEAAGNYVDVCAVYRGRKELRVLSQKGGKGYGIFAQQGVYFFEISARASGASESVRMAVQWGDGGWDDLKVLSCTKIKRSAWSRLKQVASEA